MIRHFASLVVFVAPSGVGGWLVFYLSFFLCALLEFYSLFRFAFFRGVPLIGQIQVGANFGGGFGWVGG